jgi:hypothetical protein
MRMMMMASFRLQERYIYIKLGNLERGKAQERERKKKRKKKDGMYTYSQER